MALLSISCILCMEGEIRIASTGIGSVLIGELVRALSRRCSLVELNPHAAWYR